MNYSCISGKTLHTMQNLIKQYHSRQKLNELLSATIQAQELDLSKVQQLLKAGADPNYTDSTGYCILDCISLNHPSEKEIGLLKILLKYGANPNYRLYSNNGQRGCLLHNINMDSEVVHLLRDHGAIPAIKLEKTDKYPRFSRGHKNPELVQDNFYEHMISAGLYPGGLREYIIDINRDRSPGKKRKKRKKQRIYGKAKDIDIPQDNRIWHYHRYGISSTILPDGSVVNIGGGHEDYYDPDFCIFNDVLKIDPNGKMELYFYNKKAFPPTDFHSATLHNGQIIIIGGIGYHEQLQDGVTKVFSLDLNHFTMSEWRTKGENPGWIFKHTALADLENDRILVFGGKSTTEEELQGVYCLHLKEKRWEKLKEDNQ